MNKLQNKNQAVQARVRELLIILKRFKGEKIKNIRLLLQSSAEEIDRLIKKGKKEDADKILEQLDLAISSVR